MSLTYRQSSFTGRYIYMVAVLRLNYAGLCFQESRLCVCLCPYHTGVDCSDTCYKRREHPEYNANIIQR